MAEVLVFRGGNRLTCVLEALAPNDDPAAHRAAERAIAQRLLEEMRVRRAPQKRPPALWQGRTPTGEIRTFSSRDALRAAVRRGEVESLEYEERIRRFEAEHPGVTRAEARGHVGRPDLSQWREIRGWVDVDVRISETRTRTGQPGHNFVDAEAIVRDHGGVGLVEATIRTFAGMVHGYGMRWRAPVELDDEGTLWTLWLWARRR